MIFGQMLAGASVNSAESTKRGQKQPFMVRQSSLFADIQPWSIGMEWVEQCNCPKPAWDTITSTTSLITYEEPTSQEWDSSADQHIQIIRCNDGC